MNDICEGCGQETNTLNEDLECTECLIERSEFLVDRLREQQWI
jgi:hypothetical protein